MKILVFGRTGQVATELCSDKTVHALSRSEADLSDPVSCRAKIFSIKPSAVINAAAYTAVDMAETHEELAFLVNCKAPKAMAEACRELDIPFVHISTDYVFDGTSEEPWSPDDLPQPLNAYGRTKLAGEEAVADVGGIYAILRTSWVFSAHGSNFVKTMLKLAAERDVLLVVSDQVGCPTGASEIAKACLTIAKRLRNNPELSGIYHFSGSPSVSWANFAREIFKQTKSSVKVLDVPTSDFQTIAKRPSNSRMDCRSIDKFQLQRPNWKQSLRSVLTDLGAV